MSSLRHTLRDGADEAGARVAAAIPTQDSSDSSWATIVHARRRRLAWQAGGIAGVAAVAATAIAGLWPSETGRFEPAGTIAPDPVMSIGPASLQGEASLVLGTDSAECGRPISAATGVTVHQAGILPDGTSLTHSETTLADDDPLVVAAADAGQAQVAGAVVTEVTSTAEGSQSAFMLRTSVVTTIGGVVMGVMPAETAAAGDGLWEEVRPGAWVSTALEPTINGCGNSDEDDPDTPSQARVLIAQILDAEGAPVATWVVPDPTPVAGPTQLGKVSLECGASLPEALPESIESRALATADVNTSIWIGSPASSANDASIVVARLQLRRWHPELDYYATAVLTLDDEIVGSTPLRPAFDDTARIADVDDETGTLLFPGSCQAGTVAPTATLTSDPVVAQSLYARFAIIAVDPDGEVVGTWLQPYADRQLVPTLTFRLDD